MSASYPDLPHTSYPDSEQTFLNMMDILLTDAPLIKQWHEAIQNQDMTTAALIWQQIPNVSQKILTANLLNTSFDTTVALERYFLGRWSPAYIVSSTEPLGQETGDFWFDTSRVTY